MYKVNIFGAGSIGNHLAHAFRTKKWEVIMSDIDPKALNRSKHEIYKSRYGAWDEAVKLADSRDLISERADIVFIGTPPQTHWEIVRNVLKNFTPKVLLVEKPLCGPDLQGAQEVYDTIKSKDTIALVGYNHILAKAAVLTETHLRSGKLGKIETLSGRIREHWGGIFNAHPWLTGPKDTYLGFSSKGGGAIGEHSHGINLWQHFAHLTGAGKILQVNATLDLDQSNGCDYDKIGIATFTTESGLVGDLIQDVVTFPPEKLVRIQGSEGYAEMRINYNSEGDAVISAQKNKPQELQIIPKKRSDDFIQEVQHIEDLLLKKTENSPISIERGLDTMLVIAAIFKSHHTKSPVNIDWSQGYTSKALQ